MKEEVITTIKKRGQLSRTIGLILYILAASDILSIIYTVIVNFVNSMVISPAPEIQLQVFQLAQKPLIPFIIDYYFSFGWIVLTFIEAIVLIVIGRWLRKDKKEVTITKIEIKEEPKT
ncbi:MAG: hypothetical protein ABH986_05135 [archaeon]